MAASARCDMLRPGASKPQSGVICCGQPRHQNLTDITRAAGVRLTLRRAARLFQRVWHRRVHLGLFVHFVFLSAYPSPPGFPYSHKRIYS
ncbi:hypothetical protein OJE16_07075 [Pantoea tagorei]